MSTKKERFALLLGFTAISLFGFTLPMTRHAVTQLHPMIVGMGRAFVAGWVALLILWIQRAPWPNKRHLFSLCIVGFCISIAFPTLVSFAMQYLPASHGAIVIGLLPIGTTYCISLMKHERPSGMFWAASLVGGLAVIFYAVYKSGGVLHPADLLLLLTVVVGSLGYAHGAIVAKRLGGLQVMCWALGLMMPVLTIASVPYFLKTNYAAISWDVWGAFLYITFISQFFGMVLWYRALSMGSVIKVSQVQLLQPFMTILFSALFFQEHIDRITIITAMIVVISIQFSRKASVENVVHFKN
jgi:drug/metabolite transporter (DMT)-like permease